ncbi:hypothetical protein MRX96_008508 [Rhipicephalus microplus]
MQESIRQQQETIRKQAEVITKLTSEQPRSGTQWSISAPPTATLTLSDAMAATTATARDGQDPQAKESPLQLGERVGRKRGPGHGQRRTRNRIRLVDLIAALQDHRGPGSTELRS